jgi:acyl-CoA synthetase (NDP forming)
MLASSTSDQYERTLTAVLADDNVDSAIVIFIPPMVTAGDDVARAIKRAAATDPAKPVLSVFMGSEPAADLLRPIPAFVFPEAAASALAHATRYGAWQRSPVGAVPVFPDIDANLARATVAGVLARGGGWAEPREAAALLRATGIPAARAEQVEHEEAAVAASTSMGFPVALKAFGPTIIHKTELGAIRLNLATADDVRAAFRELKSALGESMTGVLVQEMVTGGVEMLVGSVEDPAFGPIVACALGGTTAELFSDSAFRLAPLTDLDAASMIDTLRCAPLLRGYRGTPVADERALRDALLRISTLVTMCPEIQEIDINPLRVLPEGVRALDLRVRVGRPVSSPNMRRVQY